jgi:hypothetical protein
VSAQWTSGRMRSVMTFGSPKKTDSLLHGSSGATSRPSVIRPPPVVPPHVDYSLTPAGNKFAEAVALLCAWAV